MSRALNSSTFCYRIPFFVLSLIRYCSSPVSKGVSMGLIRVFLLVFFIAPQIHAQTLVAPTGLTANADANGINLSWTAPSDSTQIVAYGVFRCVDPCTDDDLGWIASVPDAGDLGNAPTTYADTDVTSSTTYRYAVLAYYTTDWTESDKSSSITETAEETTTPTLMPPTGLTATYDASTTTITLSWTAPSNDIVGYNIYRCEGSPCTLKWTAWVANTGDAPPAPTEYVDTDVTSGTAYRYAVTSSNAAYDESAQSGTVRKNAGTPPPPVVLRVIGLKATAVSEDSISLGWKPTVKDVMTSYSVYRCTVPEDESTCDPYDGLWIAALENTNAYTDTKVTSGETYRYAVAVEPYRRKELSRAITVVAQMPQMLSAPTGLMVTEVDESSVRLRWTAPEDDGRGPVESIDIYRCNVDRSPDCSEFLYLTSRNPALTYYKDNDDVEPGTTYRYAVAAYRSADEVSPWSNQVTATTRSLGPGAPIGLTAVTSESGIRLSWSAPVGDIIAGYSVYRCEEGGTPCTPQWIAWVANPGDSPPAPTQYDDTDVTSGTTYRYAVTSNDRRYRQSDWSDEVTALAPEIMLAAPTGLTVMATSETSVSLTWTAPADGILGYNVYRCSVPENETICELEWHAWVANEDDAPPAPTSYTDTGGETGGMTAGATYLYTVSASYPPDYQDSEQSEAVTAVAQQISSTDEFEASFESGHQWFRRDVIPELSGNTTWHSIVWKGERIQQHILVNNVPSDSQVSLVSSDLTSTTNHIIPASSVSFRYPRFVAGHTEVRSCARDYQEGNTTVYLSDALFSEPAQTLPASWPELAWMSVDIPSETPAGEYTGTVTVSAVSGETSTAMATLQVSIQVAPWAMPETSERQFHLDFWQFPVSVLDRYNDANPGDRIEIWSEEHYALLEPTYRYLAELGQRTVTTYIKEGALGAPSMIQWTLKSNDTWEYDYSVFDAYVVRLASWGLDQQISAFSPIGWNLGDIPYWDEATQSKKTFHSDVGSSAWNTRWSHFLTDFRAHLLEKEWFDKTVLYLDESSGDDAEAVINLVRPIDESWKIGLAYGGYGRDGPGEDILSKLYDSSGQMVLVGTTYVDTGLITGETYRYAVDACSDNCSAASSPVTTVAQTPAVPGEPTDLTAMSGSGITLSWTTPAATGSGALTGYNIYRCVDEPAPCTPVWFDRVVSGTAYTDSEVAANTTYRYTVTTCNGTGCGNPSGEITVTTGDTVNQQSAGNQSTVPGQTQENQAVPAVPTGLTSFAASATATQLSWTGNATNGYDVYRCTGSETCTPETYLGWTYADNQADHPERISTFYTSCVQLRPNSFVAANADPADMAALPWHALQRRQDGYLRWAFDNWKSYDPLDLREGAFTAGDFSLVYRSSNDKDMTVVPGIRSELLRDGIEDFEKVQVLRNSLSGCAEDELAGRWLSRLERTADTFSSGPLMAGRAGDIISQAHERLGEISLQLTPDMCQ